MKKLTGIVSILLGISLIFAQSCPDPEDPRWNDYGLIYQCEGPYLGSLYEAHHLVRESTFTENISLGVADQSYPPKELNWDENLVYCVNAVSYNGQLDIGIFGYEILEGSTTPRASSGYMGDFFDEKTEQYFFQTGLGYKPFWSGTHFLKFSTPSGTSGDFWVTIDAYRIVESCGDSVAVQTCICPEGTRYVPEENMLFGVPTREPCQVIANPDTYVPEQCVQ